MDLPFAATATFTAAYLNAHRGKDTQPVEPSDLIPSTARRVKPDMAATTLAQFRALAQMRKKK